MERIDIPRGRAPAVDGALSPGEWDDAGRVEIEVEPGWTVPVRFKHDGASLYVAFTDLKRDGAERYPEVLLDVAGDRSAAWAADDRWIHASYQDCEGQGVYNDFRCSPAKPGWEANNFPLDPPGTVEIRISYEKIGLDPAAAGEIGIAFNVTDTRTRYHFWPRGATLESPATWGRAASAAGWGPGPLAAGRVETFHLRNTPVGDSLEVSVYLPPGYDPARRYPALYAFLGQPYFAFRQVLLPAWLDSAIVAGMEPVVAIGLPGPEALAGMRPDTPEGEAFRRFLATEIVAAVEARYPVRRERDGRWLIGFSAGANVAVDLAARHPELFGRVAAQSPGWMFWSQETQGISEEFTAGAVRSVRSAGPGPRAAFWFVWGDADDEWERRSRDNGERVVAALRATGASVEIGTRIPGGHGLHQIRGSLAEALAFLLAPAPVSARGKD